MNDRTETNSRIVARYRERTPGSAAATERAREVLPGGLVHDARRTDPYPIYVNRAAGPRKWDVDGNEYIDYYGGHGALILGHNDPEVMAAATAQLALGTHYGACHELEVRWAEQVKSMVPCADRVRFTSSGTEANLMALRLARAHTGRAKIVRFLGHFHGWQDHVSFGVDAHFDGTPSPGVLEGVAAEVILADPFQPEAVEALLRGRDDVAAVILEPTGGSFGVLPLPPGMLEMLRAVTAERGIVLIFDEVVTGFRVSPGGAQAHHGVTPDLATFAKILAGGLPGGAVTGSEAIMGQLDFAYTARTGREKVAHQGTYNANPVSAAAGTRALERVIETDACATASARAARLRHAINEALSAEGIPWAAYGEHSSFYIYTNPDGHEIDPFDFDPLSLGFSALRRGGAHPAANALRLAVLVNGADISGKPGGLTSAAHTEADIDATAAAIHAALRMLKDEDAFAA